MGWILVAYIGDEYVGYEEFQTLRHAQGKAVELQACGYRCVIAKVGKWST